MHPVSKLVIVAAFGLTCAACSSNHGAPAAGSSAPAASAPAVPPASAIPLQAPPASSAATASPETPQPPKTAPAFGVIMQRPSFATAFAAMDGASKLPAWVKTSDATTPSTRVQVEGSTLWLAHVCKTADCAGGQLFLLIDPSDHTMQGLFVETSGSAGASVRKLTWLGKPDPAAQKFLEAQAAHG